MIMQAAVGSDLSREFSEPQTSPSVKEASCRLAFISPQIPTSSAVLTTKSGGLRLPVTLPACALATP